MALLTLVIVTLQKHCIPTKLLYNTLMLFPHCITIHVVCIMYVPSLCLCVLCSLIHSSAMFDSLLPFPSISTTPLNYLLFYLVKHLSFILIFAILLVCYMFYVLCTNHTKCMICALPPSFSSNHLLCNTTSTQMS